MWFVRCDRGGRRRYEGRPDDRHSKPRAQRGCGNVQRRRAAITAAGEQRADDVPGEEQHRGDVRLRAEREVEDARRPVREYQPDGKIVWVATEGKKSIIYRVDAKTGQYAPWQAKGKDAQGNAYVDGSLIPAGTRDCNIVEYRAGTINEAAWRWASCMAAP